MSEFLLIWFDVDLPKCLISNLNSHTHVGRSNQIPLPPTESTYLDPRLSVLSVPTKENNKVVKSPW